MDKTNGYKGSITVEAAIVVPLFICIFTGLIIFIKMFVMQIYVDDICSTTAREISIYSFLEVYDKGNIPQPNQADDEDNILDLTSYAIGTYIAKEVNSELVEYLAKTNGLNNEFVNRHKLSNISYEGSEILKDNGDVEIIIDFSLDLNLPLFPILQIDMQSRSVIRSWRNERIMMVWVSKYGSKYHLYGCNYIFKNISEVERDDLGELKPCKKCKADKHRVSKYYKSTNGFKYHIKGCISIFKEIEEIKLDDAVGKYTPCKKCFAKGANDK